MTTGNFQLGSLGALVPFSSTSKSPKTQLRLAQGHFDAAETPRKVIGGPLKDQLTHRQPATAVQAA